MNIGRRIKELRTERGWSQNELAKRSGANAKLISRYEHGHVNPTIEIVRRLSIAFGVSVDALIFDELHRETIKDRELYELFMKVDKLDIKYRNMIKDVARVTVDNLSK